LKRGWSPEQIAVGLRRTFPDEPSRWVCAETIYQAVYRPDLGGLPREFPGRGRTDKAGKRLRCGDAQRRRSGPATGMTKIDDRPVEEERKRQLDEAIQAEHVRASLFEDEASIGALYARFAHAIIDTAET
jgi:IS30 family transposase